MSRGVSKISTALPKVLLVLVGVSLALLLCEWGLRIINLERLPFTDPDLYRSDPELSYTMRPEMRVYSHGTWFETNRHGLRGPDWSGLRASHQRAVLFLGDSVVAGFGVSASESVVGQFTRLSDSDLVGINLGHCGYNAQQALKIAARFDSEVDPVAVVYMFVSNDFEPVYDIFTPWIDGESESKGMLEQLQGALRRNSVLYARTRKAWSRLNGGGAPREIPINEDLLGLTEESRANFDSLERGLRRLRQRAGVPLVLTAFPIGLPEEASIRLERIAARVGARWVDLGDLWSDTDDYRHRGMLSWDSHPNAEAHRLMAERIVPVVDEALAVGLPE